MNADPPPPDPDRGSLTVARRVRQIYLKHSSSVVPQPRRRTFICIIDVALQFILCQLVTFKFRVISY